MVFKKSKKTRPPRKESLFVQSERFPVQQALESALEIDFGIEATSPAPQVVLPPSPARIHKPAAVSPASDAPTETPALSFSTEAFKTPILTTSGDFVSEPVRATATDSPDIPVRATQTGLDNVDAADLPSEAARLDVSPMNESVVSAKPDESASLSVVRTVPESSVLEITTHPAEPVVEAVVTATEPAPGATGGDELDLPPVSSLADILGTSVSPPADQPEVDSDLLAAIQEAAMPLPEESALLSMFNADNMPQVGSFEPLSDKESVSQTDEALSDEQTDRQLETLLLQAQSGLTDTVPSEEAAVSDEVIQLPSEEPASTDETEAVPPETESAASVADQPDLLPELPELAGLDWVEMERLQLADPVLPDDVTDEKAVDITESPEKPETAEEAEESAVAGLVEPVETDYLWVDLPVLEGLEEPAILETETPPLPEPAEEPTADASPEVTAPVLPEPDEATPDESDMKETAIAPPEAADLTAASLPDSASELLPIRDVEFIATAEPLESLGLIDDEDDEVLETEAEPLAEPLVPPPGLLDPEIDLALPPEESSADSALTEEESVPDLEPPMEQTAEPVPPAEEPALEPAASAAETTANRLKPLTRLKRKKPKSASAKPVVPDSTPVAAEPGPIPAAHPPLALPPRRSLSLLDAVASGDVLRVVLTQPAAAAVAAADAAPRRHINLIPELAPAVKPAPQPAVTEPVLPPPPEPIPVLAACGPVITVSQPQTFQSVIIPQQVSQPASPAVILALEPRDVLSAIRQQQTAPPPSREETIPVPPPVAPELVVGSEASGWVPEPVSLPEAETGVVEEDEPAMVPGPVIEVAEEHAQIVWDEPISEETLPGKPLEETQKPEPKAETAPVAESEPDEPPLAFDFNLDVSLLDFSLETLAPADTDATGLSIPADAPADNIPDAMAGPAPAASAEDLAGSSPEPGEPVVEDVPGFRFGTFDFENEPLMAPTPEPVVFESPEKLQMVSPPWESGSMEPPPTALPEETGWVGPLPEESALFPDWEQAIDVANDPLLMPGLPGEAVIEPAASDDPIEILASHVLSDPLHLLLVNYEGTYALMVDDGEEAVTIKTFSQNPLQYQQQVAVTQEAILDNKVLYIAQVGSWRGILAVTPDAVQIQAEI